MSADYALPTSSQPSHGDYSIGTMFLAQADHLYLIGAAHSPIGAQPHSRWLEWPLEVIVWPTPKMRAALPLFTQLMVGRLPLFRYEPHGDGSDCLHDMLAARANGGAFPNTPIVDLRRSFVRPAPGAVLTCFGYPAVGKATWPYAPAKPVKGLVASGGGPMILAEAMASKDGHSGGPVFDAQGNFAGMLIGYDDDGTRKIVPADALQRLVG
jgi:hypothetical protein